MLDHLDVRLTACPDAVDALRRECFTPLDAALRARVTMQRPRRYEVMVDCRERYLSWRKTPNDIDP